ncbi:hypothetical protein ABK040_013078 [Willaertia magna]
MSNNQEKIQQFFKSYTIAEMMKHFNKKKEIISLKNNQSLKEALLILANNNILSAPVYNEENKCIGLLDVLDCATFTKETFYKNSETSEWKNYLLQFSFDIEKVESVINMSGKNPYIPMVPSDSLFSLLEKFSNGVHRIPIINPTNEEVIFVCSQMTLFTFLFQTLNEPLLPLINLLRNKNIQEILPNLSKVISVKETQLAIEAIKEISERGISAIGVTSQQTDQLIGCISASDLQGFIDEDYHHLASPVLEFQRKSKEKKNLKNIPDLVFCKGNQLLDDVINRLLIDKVHRIFIMNDNMEVLGLISLTDIFNILFKLL